MKIYVRMEVKGRKEVKFERVYRSIEWKRLVSKKEKERKKRRSWPPLVQANEEIEFSTDS